MSLLQRDQAKQGEPPKKTNRKWLKWQKKLVGFFARKNIRDQMDTTEAYEMMTGKCDDELKELHL